VDHVLSHSSFFHCERDVGLLRKGDDALRHFVIRRFFMALLSRMPCDISHGKVHDKKVRCRQDRKLYLFSFYSGLETRDGIEREGPSVLVYKCNAQGRVEWDLDTDSSSLHGPLSLRCLRWIPDQLVIGVTYAKVVWTEIVGYEVLSQQYRAETKILAGK
jgi:hypothetical protein